jgi:hypothetical protein
MNEGRTQEKEYNKESEGVPRQGVVVEGGGN